MTGTQAPPPASAGATLEDIAAFAAGLGAGRLLGLDLGTKTIGLALTDARRVIASPLITLKRVKFTQDAVKLLDIVTEHQIAGLVLGLPTNLDGTAGPRVQATRAFARNLNKLCPLPILLWDERLTTAEAERMLIEADQSRRRRAEVVDKLAATIILQNVLERLRTLG
jgi:putative holliday junction resolvase